MYRIDELRSDKPNAVRIEYTRAASPSLDYFIGTMAELLAFEKTFDPKSPDPLRPINEMINAFIQQRVGCDYNTLTRDIDYDALVTNDFAGVPEQKRNLKKKLFHYRATIYLCSLAATAARGYDVEALLEDIALAKILPIKKEEHEPAFDILKARLQK